MIYLFTSLETKDDYFYNPLTYTVYLLGDYVSVRFRIDDINSKTERCDRIQAPLITQKRYKMLENMNDGDMHHIINNVILEKIFDKL